MSGSFDAHEGRALFGADPRGYDAIRPAYPEEIYDFLHETGALRPGVATLEIGAGSGLASRRLLELGVEALTLVEPDARFAPLLHALAESSRADVRVLTDSFEDADLPLAHFALVVAATSFHWLKPAAALARIAALLEPGGFVALWWHVFGDPERDDAFHEATRSILGPLESSPSGAPDAVPFALDAAARLRDFANSGKFAEPERLTLPWTLVLDTEQVGALYSTFSPISRLPEARREAIVRDLMHVAEQEFGGRVERNMVSPVYVARRLFHSAASTA